MADIIFYEKPGCASNARQKQLLTAAGHNVISRNLLSEVWSAGRLRAFFRGLPVGEWFNRAAPRVKSGEVVPENLDVVTALRLMQADPLLIRRPLMECGDRRIAGFDVPRVEAWLGAPLTPEARGDLQSCRRPERAGACPDPD